MNRRISAGSAVSKVILGIVLVLVVVWLVMRFVFPSGIVMSLPSEASGVHEQKSRSGLDVVHILKARMSLEGFEKWHLKEGFVPAPPNLKKRVVWQADWAESWWGPSPDTESTYYYPGFKNWSDPNFKSNDYCVVKYENGYMYYKWKDI